MSDLRGPKESAFDAHIRPLVDEVLRLCKEHKINFATYFALDEMLPNVVLQFRQALAVDETDLTGAKTVVDIWDLITDGEGEQVTTLSSVGQQGEGN